MSGARLRICYFNRSYWPDTGATGQLLTELAEDLAAEHGMDVTVVTGYPVNQTGPLPAREMRNGVRIVRARGTTFPPRRFIGRALNYLTYFWSAVLAAIRLPRQDVTIALTDPPIIGLAAFAARPRHGVDDGGDARPAAMAPARCRRHQEEPRHAGGPAQRGDASDRRPRQEREDHPDKERQVGSVGQREHARGLHAVVVGDQDAHQAAFSILARPPMYGRSASGITTEPSACW